MGKSFAKEMKCDVLNVMGANESSFTHTDVNPLKPTEQLGVLMVHLRGESDPMSSSYKPCGQNLISLMPVISLPQMADV